MAALTARPAILLDRDGTLNSPAAPGDYIREPHELRLLDGVGEAVDLLHRNGFLCVVVSNQRGVAIGRMTAQQLATVDRRLHELVALDGSYYCTHGHDHRCACRKPRAGLLIRAAAELELDLAQSWMIGDSDSDLEAGRRVGCRTFRVRPSGPSLLDAATEIIAKGK